MPNYWICRYCMG